MAEKISSSRIRTKEEQEEEQKEGVSGHVVTNPSPTTPTPAPNSTPNHPQDTTLKEVTVL
jgi:hypothetical protein